jgi:hypothetical protein
MAQMAEDLCGVVIERAKADKENAVDLMSMMS